MNSQVRLESWMGKSVGMPDLMGCKTETEHEETVYTETSQVTVELETMHRMLVTCQMHPKLQTERMMVHQESYRFPSYLKVIASLIKIRYITQLLHLK